MEDDTPKCLVCGEGLGLAKPVWCVDCQTPHHHECFAYAGRCAIFGCSGRRFSESRSGPGVSTIEIHDSDGTPAMRNFIVDFTSHRELSMNLAIWAALALTGAGWITSNDIFEPGPAGLEMFCVGLVLLVAALVIRRGISDYRVVAGKDRMIWLHKSFLGQRSLLREATFTECRQVVVNQVQHERDQGQASRTWTVWVDLVDDSAICMTDEVNERVPHLDAPPRPPAAVTDAANGIAAIIGVPQTSRRDWSPPHRR